MTKISTILLMMFFSFSIRAQFNAYYWSHQYGAKGQLLNGAVIASCDDETAIFYNPAAMSMNEEFGVAVSLIAPTYGNISTSNLFGKGTAVTDGGFNLSPGLVAAKFSPFGSKKIQVGLCSFTRYKSSLHYRDRLVNKTTDGQNNIFAGYLNFNSDLNETWLGLGASYKINNVFSIGATQFFSSRSEKTLLDFRKEIINSNFPDDLLYGWRSKFEYGYSVNGGLLSKVGMIWQAKKFKLGITYTTPTFHIFSSSADYDYDDQKVNDNGKSSVESNLRKVDVIKYKTPRSFGFGLEFLWNTKTRVSFSAEYFSKIPTYILFTDTDDRFNGLLPQGISEQTTVRNGNESVLNLAIGVEKTLGDKMTWLWGLRSDFSPKTSTEIRQNIGFLANTPGLIHISTGGIFKFKTNQISCGLDFGFGTKSGGKEFTDLANITPANIFTFAGDNSVSSKVKVLTLSLTYDF